jgi:hypothetical protein
MKVLDAYKQPIRGAAVAADSPKQKYFTRYDGGVIMKLGAGHHKIRVSVAGRKVKEVMLEVSPGGDTIEVDM